MQLPEEGAGEAEGAVTLSHTKRNEVAAVAAGDLEAQLPSDVREVLLDVILMWANLDMVTAFFLSSVSGLNPDDGAKRFGRKEIADKLKKAAKRLRSNGATDLASRIEEMADSYPNHAFYRKRIAHSRCAGVRKSDPTRLIFLPFEQEGPPGHLAMEIIDLSLFMRAADWARSEHEFLLDYVDRAGFFLGQP
ncbi:hypothetical protein [Aurantiacibacter suaedae]|uniref:hypothetical protein n=1 Tax=Aurantiacibacter suaedae TaxID=2545755 RepID=UPI0019D558CA|nr:hypothetical protein [Aurantiacibacter suaedae]